MKFMGTSPDRPREISTFGLYRALPYSLARYGVNAESRPSRSSGGKLAERGGLGIAGIFVALSSVRLAGLLGEGWGFLGAFGVDYRFFMDAGHRFVAGQGFYAPYQLAGPYEVNFLGGDVLYPPPAALFFGAFSLLPAILWWLVPLGILAYAVYRWRPAPWTWPLIAFALWWPATWQAVIYGSTSLWIAAFITGGLLWGWTAPLVLLKPTYGIFALIGARKRSWRLGVGLVGLLSLLTLPLWPDYLTAMRNAHMGSDAIGHTLGHVPLLLVPVIGWLGQHAPSDTVFLRRVRDREHASAVGQVVDGGSPDLV